MWKLSILLLLALQFARNEANCDIPALPSSQLKDVLLCGYDKTSRPKVDHRNATKVMVKMILKNFIYDMHTSTITVNSWLAYVWKDDHLVWKPEDYSNIKNVHIASDQIWVPDISIYNRIDQSGSASAFNAVDCLVSQDGTVVCISPNRHDALCAPDLTSFPFDVLNCSMRFGSWVHSGEEISPVLAVPPVTLEDYEPIGEWRLVKAGAEKYEGKYNCCPNSTYPTLNYNFEIERHSGAIVCMVLVPAMVMILMTMVSLTMGPNDVSRIALICTNIIMHMLFMQNISWQVPVAGPQTPLIIIYTRDSLFLCAFTLVLTALHRKLLQTTIETPVWISAIMSKIPVDKILIFSSRIVEEDETNIVEDSQSRSKNKDWMIIAIVLDSLCFFIYSIIYLCMFIAFVP